MCMKLRIRWCLYNFVRSRFGRIGAVTRKHLLLTARASLDTAPGMVKPTKLYAAILTFERHFAQTCEFAFLSIGYWRVLPTFQ